jgi:hypothetical protein
MRCSLYRAPRSWASGPREPKIKVHGAAVGGDDALAREEGPIHSGSFTGTHKRALDLREGCVVKLVRLDQPLLAGERVVSADGRCVVEVLDSPRFNGDTSSWSPRATSPWRSTPPPWPGAPGGGRVVSNGAPAVSLSGASRFEIRKSDSLLSTAASAVRSDGASTFVAEDLTTEVRGMGGHGVQAGTGDSVRIERVPMVQGDAGCGISTGDGLALHLREVPQILGLGGHGIAAGTTCGPDLGTPLTLVQGLAGSGLLAGSSGRLAA